MVTHRANLHQPDAYSNYSEKSILKICKYVWGSFDLPGSENFYCDSDEICYHTNNLDQQYYTIILRTMFPVYRSLSLYVYCFLSGGMYMQCKAWPFLPSYNRGRKRPVAVNCMMRSLPIDSKSHAGVHKRTYILPEETTIDIVLVVNKYGGGHLLIINFYSNVLLFSAPVDWRTFVNSASASANFSISLLTKLLKFATSLHNKICSFWNCEVFPYIWSVRDEVFGVVGWRGGGDWPPTFVWLIYGLRLYLWFVGVVGRDGICGSPRFTLR